MKTKDIAKKYSIDQGAFEEFISSKPEVKKEYGMMGSIEIKDDIVESTVNLFKQETMEKEKAQKEIQAEKKRVEAGIQQKMNSNGFSENAIAKALKLIAICIYVFGCIGGIIVGVYGESLFSALYFLIAVFVVGTMMLGFSEIVRLLDSINKKMDRK